MIIDLLSNRGLIVVNKHEWLNCERVVNNLVMNDYEQDYYQS